MNLRAFEIAGTLLVSYDPVAVTSRTVTDRSIQSVD